MKLLGVILDTKLTFESHIRFVASNVTQKIGLLRKCKSIYANDDIVRNCFYSFILPLFEYCSPVWVSAAETHLRLLDKAFGQIKFLLPTLNISLSHRRIVGSLSYLYKIYSNPTHPVYHLLPPPYRPSRVTRYSVMINDRAFSLPRCHSTQFTRSFFPLTCGLWNTLPNEIVCSTNVDAFKRRANSFLLS